MPYLNNAEENELKRLKTTKGTRSSSIGYWGEEGLVGFGFIFGDF
jgi:hypothetical protein